MFCSLYQFNYLYMNENSLLIQECVELNHDYDVAILQSSISFKMDLKQKIV